VTVVHFSFQSAAELWTVFVPFLFRICIVFWWFILFRCCW